MPTEYGDGAVATKNTILRTLVGSGVHGVAIEGTGDRDEMGIFIEPPEWVLSPNSNRMDYVYRTADEGARSTPIDLDLILYGLRKFLHLALKGNPTILLPLWCQPDDIVTLTPAGSCLRSFRDEFMSRSAVYRFVGYLDSQVLRMMGGGRQSRVPNRPELVEQYGFDVKYGSHALRLGYQGLQVASTGALTLPLPADEREMVLAVKRGEFSLQDVHEMVVDLRTQILAALLKSDLPHFPDKEKIARLSVEMHRQAWGWSDD